MFLAEFFSIFSSDSPLSPYQDYACARINLRTHCSARDGTLLPWIKEGGVMSQHLVAWVLLSRSALSHSARRMRESAVITRLRTHGLPSVYRARLSSERQTVNKPKSPPSESSSLISQTRLRRLWDTREQSAPASVHRSRTPPFAATRDRPEIDQRSTRDQP